MNLVRTVQDGQVTPPGLVTALQPALLLSPLPEWLLQIARLWTISPDAASAPALSSQAVHDLCLGSTGNDGLRRGLTQPRQQGGAGLRRQVRLDEHTAGNLSEQLQKSQG